MPLPITMATAQLHFVTISEKYSGIQQPTISTNAPAQSEIAQLSIAAVRVHNRESHPTVSAKVPDDEA